MFAIQGNGNATPLPDGYVYVYVERVCERVYVLSFVVFQGTFHTFQWHWSDAFRS